MDFKWDFVLVVSLLKPMYQSFSNKVSKTSYKVGKISLIFSFVNLNFNIAKSAPLLLIVPNLFVVSVTSSKKFVTFLFALSPVDLNLGV
ncbi:hypothetical protein ONA22_07370 [Mycoplasmopsis cynos]|uniref:hypothetical protein n=1 Tax=Mycoplasmopsis cynos TaxID=171284 RepID=UPI0024CAC836|nr:hypothetical protein [Mycoplasmopsis cynos]WAM03469.1 hypothetical protein ONA22_07370 [Mycoplasmopsis cynos]